MTNKDKMVEIYKAPNEMEAKVIRSLLESYDIPCFLKSNAAPSVHLFTVDGMGEVKVMVLESMADEAKSLIKSEDDV